MVNYQTEHAAVAADGPPPDMTGVDSIIALRTAMRLSQAEFAALLGLASKGNVSIIERDNRCSLRVALLIEQLSGGRIDAGLICADVLAARAGCDCHGVAIATEMDASSPDNGGDNIGAAA